MTVWLLALALAEEPAPRPVMQAPERGVWLGVQGSLVEDRVQDQIPASLGLHGSAQPLPWLGADLSATWVPKARNPDWDQPILRSGAYPSLVEGDEELARIAWHTALVARVTPLRGDIGNDRLAVPLALYGLAGPALTRTRDDLAALLAEDSPEAQATQYQIHPTLDVGGGISLASGRLRGELEARQLRYTEEIESEALVKMRPWFVTLRLAVRLGAPAPS